MLEVFKSINSLRNKAGTNLRLWKTSNSKLKLSIILILHLFHIEVLEKKFIWEAEVDYKLHLSLDLREFFQSWIARALLPEQNHVCTWCITSAVSSIRTQNRQRICPLDFARNGRTLKNRWKTSLSWLYFEVRSIHTGRVIEVRASTSKFHTRNLLLLRINYDIWWTGRSAT